MKTISIIIPIHNERPNIRLVYERIVQVLSHLPYSFEIIYVDDGSTDGSSEEVENITGRDKTVRLIQFSRNFGKESATTAGFHRAEGDAAICVDADLQHPPELIPEFISAWEDGAEVVIGVRKNDASDTFVKKLGSKLYYRLINRMSKTEIIPRATDFRLIDRRVIDEFNNLTEHSRMTRGLIDWLGFRRALVYFDAPERMYGEASYGVGKLFQLAIESMISHSLFPLRLAGYLGFLIMVLSIPLGILMIIDRYISPLGFDFSGTGILANITLFLVGIVLASLGLLAYYIGQIHSEAKNRPLYIVRKDTKKETYGK